MTGRDRTKPKNSESIGQGKYVSSGSVIYDIQGSFTNGSSRCVDEIDGTHNDHMLAITHTNVGAVYERCNGRSSQSMTFYREMKDYVPEFYRAAGNAPAHAVVSSMSTAIASTAALARTNPSRPEVSLPVTIAELKDLPGMVRDMGRDIIRHKAIKRNYHNKVGNWYMAGIYGLAPMLSDASKLFDLQSKISKRSDELHRLYSNQGLKRRITLTEGSVKSAKSTVTVESTIGTIYCRHQSVTEWKQWATVRWLPTSLPRPSDKDDPRYRKLARNVLLGLGQDFGRVNWRNAKARNDFWSDAADAWELLPWSWAIDWFSNVGDYLAAHRNTIPAQSSRLNIMKTTTTSATYTRLPSSSKWTSGGGATLKRQTLERVQGVAPSVSADFQFLTGTQMSIVGALVLQRLRR